MKKKHSKSYGSHAEWLHALDRVNVHCFNIETLAALLEACFDEGLEVELVRNAGAMIRAELTGVLGLLENFEPRKTTKEERL